MLALEILSIAGMLTVLIASQPFRQWLRKKSTSDLRVAGAIICGIIVFHLIDVGRNTFPLVRWGMYSQVYEPDEIHWGKVRAQLQDGSTVWINPARQFPSISRNFSERFRDLVIASTNGKITPAGKQVYRDLLLSFGRRYNQAHPENRAVQVCAVLQTIRLVGEKTVVNNRIVSQVALP